MLMILYFPSHTDDASPEPRYSYSCTFHHTLSVDPVNAVYLKNVYLKVVAWSRLVVLGCQGSGWGPQIGVRVLWGI